MKRIYWILLFIVALALAHVLNSSSPSAQSCDLNTFSPILREYYSLVSDSARGVCPLRVLDVPAGKQLLYSVHGTPDMNAVVRALRSDGYRITKIVPGREWMVMADKNGHISIYYAPDRNALIVFISSRTSSS
ncbi:MAG: hypothetical protein GXN93_00755 [Candidatus Diapherotrites archaeon]|nr:hypothetical protein [Candidatus Diapherotrites archaeon]